jgi:hypothetical protein
MTVVANKSYSLLAVARVVKAMAVGGAAAFASVKRDAGLLFW